VKKYSFIGPLMAVILPFVLFLVMSNGVFVDPLFMIPREHFYIVSAVSLLAAIIAILVGVAGKRLRNIRVSFLAISFVSLALMFLLHGLSTPHFLLPVTHIPAVASQLSMLLATVGLWMSSLPSDHKLVDILSRRQSMLLPVWTLVLVVFGTVCMSFPTVMNFLPIDINPLNGALTVIILFINLLTIYRYYQTYKFSRFPLQISIVYIAGWFMVSQLIMVLGDMWRLSWWIYHFLLLASMIVMLIGIVKQYAVKGTFIGSIRAIFTNDPFERITNSISPSVKALVVATEKKDTYTVGHTFRVTMYALKLAEELRLKAEQLRAIAQGSLVHDIGKISVPDIVLNKPGKLSLEERSMIEMHPLNGYKMCKDLGFLKEELSIIRSHHEKWDGSGYPDKLKAENIPLLARIVAVADVYDALTSERSYRKAWPHSEAMDFLIEQKGIHFDPKCVEAWVILCERDPSVYQYPSEMINSETAGTLTSSF
jgi:putative nucleotidyltransferase with HDIG domain